MMSPLSRCFLLTALIAAPAFLAACSHHRHDYDRDSRVVVVDDRGYRHEGYDDERGEWHGGYYDERNGYHEDERDWHRHHGDDRDRR